MTSAGILLLDAVPFLIASWAVVVIIAAMAEALKRKKGLLNKLSICTRIFLGLFIMTDPIFRSGIHSLPQDALYLPQYMLLVSMASLTLYFKVFLCTRELNTKDLSISLIPPVLLLIYIISLAIIRNTPLVLYAYKFSFFKLTHHLVYIIITYLFIISLFRVIQFRKSIPFQKFPERFIITWIVYEIICFFTLFVFTLTDSSWFNTIYRFVFITSFFFFIINYTLRYRYPELYEGPFKGSNDEYKNTKLRGVDINKTLDDLTILMDEKKVYLDNSLSLSSLAEMLRLTTHQLSELLNGHMGKNYNNYINEYRVSYAKSLLQIKKNMTILEAAFESGFNSKTAFNNAFQKFAGVSPKRYKQKYQSAIS